MLRHATFQSVCYRFLGLLFRCLALAGHPLWRGPALRLAHRILRMRCAPAVEAPSSFEQLLSLHRVDLEALQPGLPKADAHTEVEGVGLPAHHFELTLTADHANGFGALHGGAACMIGDAAAAAAYAHICGLNSAALAPPARMLSVTLHSSLPCDNRVAAVSASVPCALGQSQGECGKSIGAHSLVEIRSASKPRTSPAVEVMSWRPCRK